ncbi:MAG: hypothetical protein GY699_10540, partial [Desulfobacteraceae bacterium]|nr:hypothetical protein [Desulfobacteraceae bacterium]
WIEREDGLLALDKNRDGIINNGSELFGNYTLKKAGKTAKNGFEALADHDDNKNGVLNTDDNIYDSLKIWVDKNRDGISQKVELHNLADLNIKSINLNADKINIKEKWNKISHEADFTQQVISETGNPVFIKKKIRDVWLATDKQDTKYIYAGVLPKDITILPDMKGKGWVKNLSYAMAEDNDLEQLVKSFLTNRASDLADLYSQADEILASWTHTNDIDPDKARGKQYILNHNYANPKIKGVFRVYAKAREVAILENFAGKKFQMKV